VKAGDVSAIGAFKSSTIEALQNVIDENNDGYFPSVSAVWQAWSLLDKHGSEVIGWKKQTKYGEVFYLDYKKALCLLLKACNLHHLAETPSVKLAISVDGADLFKGRTHVSSGVRIVNEKGVHPVTK
jgi:hypothetical protein